MSATTYADLEPHVGHDIACVTYADGENVAVECETCNEVLLDFDRDEEQPEYVKCPRCTTRANLVAAIFGPGPCWLCGGGQEVTKEAAAGWRREARL